VYGAKLQVVAASSPTGAHADFPKEFVAKIEKLYVPPAWSPEITFSSKEISVTSTAGTLESFSEIVNFVIVDPPLSDADKARHDNFTDVALASATPADVIAKGTDCATAVAAAEIGESSPRLFRANTVKL
jgi:hypothetical protein